MGGGGGRRLYLSIYVTTESQKAEFNLKFETDFCTSKF